MHVDRIEPGQWDTISENAHVAIFNETREAIANRIDYALGVRDGENVLGFVTVRELDHESIYWQYGGALEDCRNTTKILKAYRAMLEHCFETGTMNIQTLVENTNLPMLKLALKVGFLVIGTKTLHGKTYCDLYLTSENYESNSPKS